MATGGCKTDTTTLHKQLKIRATMYEHNHNEEMSSTAVAQMLSNTLYMRRFFPYYTFNIVAGLDSEGRAIDTTHDLLGCTSKSCWMMLPEFDAVCSC